MPTLIFSTINNMEQWVFNENAEAYLDFNGSKFNDLELESYTEKNLLNFEGKPLDYFTYAEDLKVFVISGDPASIGIMEVQGEFWVVRSIGRPKYSISGLARALPAKREKFKLEECIEFKPIDILNTTNLWAWDLERRRYACRRVERLPHIKVNLALTYVYDEQDEWYIITMFSFMPENSDAGK